MDALKGEELLTVNPTVAIEIKGTPVSKAAMGYMHANCSHCHNPLGVQSFMNLRHNLDSTTQQTENAYIATVGATPPRIIAGQPQNSRITIRMSARPGMPALGSEIVDTNGGLQQVTNWIMELAN